MKKLVILSLIAPAVLGLAACGGTANNTTADMNVMTDDNSMMAGNDSMMSGNDSMMSSNDAAPMMNGN